ncbi:MAG TPA: XdhC family protein [Thermoplasmata archaeon]|nr:XdhC family protein [Thermoplasmata archaeon]
MQAGHYARHLSELVARREPFAVATVTRTEGSTLAKSGFKILITEKGEVAAGTLSGGCPEGPIVEAALLALRSGEPRVLRVHLVDTESSVAGTVRETDPNEIWVQTNCGGVLEVYIEPMLPTPRLIVVGQGGKDDLEEALVHLGKRLGFEVVVVDPNPSLAEDPHHLRRESHVDPLALGLNRDDYVVVLTKGERDVAVLEAVSRAPVRFVGILASRHRLKQDLDELARRGVSEEFRLSLHAPIGVDIGAKTPEELAVAILAEVLAAKYGKDPRRASGPPRPG